MIFTDQEIQTINTCMTELNNISQHAMETRIRLQDTLNAAIQRGEAAEQGTDAAQDSADSNTKPQ